MAISLEDMINARLSDLIDPFVDKDVKDQWYQSQAGKHKRLPYYSFGSKPVRALFTNPPLSSQGDDMTSSYIGGAVYKQGSRMWQQLDDGVWGEDAKNLVYDDLDLCSNKKGKNSYWRCLYHSIPNSHIAIDTDDYTDLNYKVNYCKKQKRLDSIGGRGTYEHELDECINWHMNTDVKARLNNISEGQYGIDFAKLSDTMYAKDQDSLSKFMGPTGSELNLQQFFTGYDTGAEDSIMAQQKEDLATYATQAMPSFEDLSVEAGKTGFEEIFGEANQMYKDLYSTGASRLGTETVLDILGERGRWAEDFYNTVAELAEMDQFTT